MSEETVVEVVPASELAAIVKREQLPEGPATLLTKTFGPLHTKLTSTLESAKAVHGTGENAIDRKLARECRLALREVRCSIEGVRKDAKADALRYGKAVDGMANVLKFLCEPEEERLEAIEQFEARKEAARIAALVAERSAALVAVNADTAAFNLGTMNAETWNTVIAAATKAKTDKEEAERQAEADRIKKEADAAAERARIIAENERLKIETAARVAAWLAEQKRLEIERQAAAAKAEAERKEAAAKAEAEQKKLQAKLDAERAARKQAEAAEAKAKAEAAAAAEAAAKTAAKAKAALDAKAKAEAEAKAEADAKAQADARAKAAAEEEARLAAEAEAEAKANAPDAQKLQEYFAAVEQIPVPAMASAAGHKVRSYLCDKLAAFTDWGTEQVSTLKRKR